MKLSFTLATIVASSLGSFAHGQNTECGSVTDEATGHIYKAYKRGGFESYEHAKNLAKEMTECSTQGHLVSITSAAEQETIQGILEGCAGDNHAVIGGYQFNTEIGAANGWAWTSGEPWDYTNWCNNEPNDSSGNAEDYTGMGLRGCWNDGTEGYIQARKLFVVEFDCPRETTSPPGSDTATTPSLKEQWKVELNEEVQYAGGVFTMDYTVGEKGQGEGATVVGVYMSCPGSNLYAADNAERISSGAFQFVDGNDKELKLLPGIQNEGTSVWKSAPGGPGTEFEDQATGTATVCYAVQVLNSDKTEVVNVAQMELSVTYLLEGDFSVAGFSTKPVDTEQSNQQDTDRVAIGSICDGTKGAGEGDLLQPGDLFCVSVCSEETDFVVSKVLNLDVTSSEGGLAQNYDATSEQASFTSADGCGKVEFIVNAGLFPSDADTTGTLSIGGTVEFSFKSSRRLGSASAHEEEERMLQEGGGSTGSFEMEVGVASGGAAGVSFAITSKSTVGSLALVAGGGAILLF